MRDSPTPPTTASRGPREWLYIALILVFALIVIAPLLQPGYFWGAHDARHDVYFIFQYDKSVQDGIWFPRWSPDWTFGYGYPFFIVYGPLATFVGELFHHFLGLGFEASVKAVLALSIVLSGLAMYGFVRSWLGRNAGLVAAVAYMAIPYHLVDVYVRAALAESVALAFLPLALWGFREAVRRPRLTAILGAAIRLRRDHVDQQPGGADLHAGAGGVRGDSDLLAVAPAAGGRGGREQRSRCAGADEQRPKLRLPVRLLLAPAARLALGLGLSAAFFVPALVEQGYINQTQWFGEYYDPTQHFVYFFQLFNPAWGFGISQPGPDDVAQGSDELPVGRGRDAALAGGAGHGPPAEATVRRRGLVLGAVGGSQHLPDAGRLGAGLALPADRALRPVPVALPDAGDPAVEHPAGDVGG